MKAVESKEVALSRQHTPPILIPTGDVASEALIQVSLAGGSGAFDEAFVQDLIHRHPQCLPIVEIDPLFANPVALCRELNTLAGPIDNLLITPSGLPVLVECKLWRNPEGRRQVVGQILDYAKELARWSSSDLQREVSRRIVGAGNPIIRLLREAGHEVDEIAFNDALTLNLRRGRFLLLIIGDGIREGVEAIASYLQGHLGLHFSLGLIEMPIFRLPDGGLVVTPRVLARTSVVVRQVVEVPEGYVIEDIASEAADQDPDRLAPSNEQQKFWAEFLAGLKLDDPEQPIPNPSKIGYLSFMLPAPQGSCWLTVWRELAKGQVGIKLSSSRGYLGEVAVQRIVEDFDAVGAELGGTAALIEDDHGRSTIREFRQAGDLTNSEVRAAAFEWLRTRLNVWINVIRPRVRSVVADVVAAQGEQ